MSFINKVKNFFYEDVEEDDEEFEAREAAKREARLKKEEEKRRKTEIDRIERQRRQEVKEFAKPANDDLSERELFKSEKTFNFPMDLGDNIFDQTDYVPIEEIQEETRKEVKEEKNLYARSSKQTVSTSTKSSINLNNDNDPKRFHPSPVVSPVYGVLDKNYTVDDVIDKNLSKTKEFSIEKKSVDFDTVRNKAYKELDDEIEKTLTGKKDIFYNLEEEEKEKNTDTIEDFIEQEYDKDENDDGHGEDDVIITYEGENNEVSKSEPMVEEEENFDIELSPDVEIVSEPKEEKKTRRSKKIEKEPEEEYEEEDKEKEDLFNLIDNMYNDEEDEEEDD